jgi:hypothetical protein
MDLGKFLKQRDIIYTLCAVALSSQIVVFADLLTTTCIIPIINKDSHNNVENFIVNLRGAKIEVGKFFIAVLRLIFIVAILYIVYYITY